MRRVLQAAGRLTSPLQQGAPCASRCFADKAAKAAGKAADDAAPAEGGGATDGDGKDSEEERVVRALAAAKRRGKKLPRFAVGSYKDDMPEEVDSWPAYEPGRPLYSIRSETQPEGEHMGAGPFAQRLEEVAQQAALERASGRPAPADVQVGAALPLASRVPYEGASRVLRWATNLVLSAGYDQKHPLSNKVVLTVRLRDLAREVGLSREGVAWIVAVCGPRYTASTDTLRLVSRRYLTREDNRRDCLRIINDLVDEGAREGGGLDLKAPGAASVLARQEREKAAPKRPAGV